MSEQSTFTGGDVSATGEGSTDGPNETSRETTSGSETTDAGVSSSPDETSSPGMPPEPDVELPAGLTRMFPLPTSTGACPDPSLRLGFAGKPTLGTSGRVRVYEVGNAGTPLATIDMAQTTVDDTLGGASFKLPRGAYVDGNDVVFTLPAKGVGFGKEVYVTIDPGVVTGPQGSFSITDNETWRFTTAPAAPSDTSTLRVAAGPGGQYCSLQGALDKASKGTTITVAPGTYYGVVYVKDKQGITVRGEDRAKTIIRGVNNNNLNPSTRGRALFGSERLSDFTIENLTIENQTPQGGSQAEALTLLSCDRCVVRKATIRSLQDTLLWSGRVYAEQCYIEGNVDYIWGTGAVYFNACEIRTVGRKGYNVQARNPQNGHGYVFVDSKLTADPGITGDVLARIDVSAYPHSEVAYINCELGPHISPEGWAITGGNAPASLRFLEYQSRDPSGRLIDTSRRLAGSRQLSQNEAAQLREPAAVLGGWTPPSGE